MTEYDPDRAKRIVHLWRTTRLPRTKIAHLTDSSVSYVHKLVRGLARPEIAPDWSTEHKVTVKEVIEAYFNYPTYGVYDLARTLRTHPKAVHDICERRQLPFPGGSNI